MFRVFYIFFLIFNFAAFAAAADPAFSNLQSKPILPIVNAPSGIDINALLRDIEPSTLPSLQKKVNDTSATDAKSDVKPSATGNEDQARPSSLGPAVCLNAKGDRVECPEAETDETAIVKKMLLQRQKLESEGEKNAVGPRRSRGEVAEEIKKSKKARLFDRTEEIDEAEETAKTDEAGDVDEAGEVDEAAEVDEVEEIEAVEEEQPAEPMDVLTEIKLSSESPDIFKLPLFGMEIFEKSEHFQPLIGAAVPDNYVVGQGDSFLVSVWGRFDAEYVLSVDNEGKVQFPKVGPVRLSGLTYKEASEVLKSKAESITGVNAAVTMAGTRTIQVFVVGEANIPGAHILSPMSTVIHAVLSAGGPTDLGSLRYITLRRNGKKIANLDLYNFVIGGEVEGDRLLDNGDTIVIPRAENKIALFGTVRRPAVYELKRGEGLLELFKYAGGLRADAYGGRIQVKRSHNNMTRLVLDIAYNELKTNFKLLDGDVVRAFPLKPSIENQVSIYGHAYSTGQYSLKENMRVSDVVGSFDALKPEVELSYAVILRETGPDRNKTVISFNLGNALSNPRSEDNKLLIPNDEIYIFSKYQFADPLQAVVEGEVRNPGLYRFEKSANIADLLKLSGGLTRNALMERAEIERSLEDGSLTSYEINLSKALERDTAHNIEIADGDKLIVHSRNEPNPIKIVACFGEVNQPGEYPISEGMRVLDLIFKAGDLTKDAYLEEAHIYRIKPHSKEKQFRKINLRKALEGIPEENIFLEDLDEVVIFSVRDLISEESATIEGEVKYPGEYPIAAGMRISDLVLKAGGLGKDAYPFEAHIYRTDARTKDVFIKVFNLEEALKENIEHNLLLQDGDEIVIHSTYEINPRRTVVASGRLNKPGQYVHASNMRVRDLVIAAGGLAEDAYLAEAEVVRSEVKSGDLVEVQTIAINLGKAMEGDAEANIAVEPYDKLFVKAIPEWRETWSIEIKGEVPFPGRYYIAKGERLSSVIERAGGYGADAYLRGAVFSRESARVWQQKRFNELRNRLQEAILRVSSAEVQSALSSEDVKVQEQYLNAQQALLEKLDSIKATGRVVVKLLPLEGLKGSEWDLVLENGDALDIPKIPQVVNVVGEVYNPTSLLWEPDNQQVFYYLNKTGGPTPDSEEKEIYVVRADGTVVSRNSLNRNNWWSTGIEDLSLYPGDTILVPPAVLRVSFMKELSNITQTLYQIAVTAGVVVGFF